MATLKVIIHYFNTVFDNREIYQKTKPTLSPPKKPHIKPKQLQKSKALKTERKKKKPNPNLLTNVIFIDTFIGNVWHSPNIFLKSTAMPFNRLWQE